MRIHDLLHQSPELSILVQHCSQFLEESEGLPLFKMLPTAYDDFHKVKVRQKKQQDLDVVFNEAFRQYPGLRQRAVFAQPYGSFHAIGEGKDPFFIFPIDGYKYMWSTEIENSHEEYQTVFEAIVKGVGAKMGAGVITDMLQFTYTDANLTEGIENDSEIIFYNIPYYYAVRTSYPSAEDDYVNLLTDIVEL
jgi:hypothetical protein